MKSIEELKDSLTLAIDKYKDDEKILKYMQDIYKEKNLSLITVGMIFKQQKTMFSLNDLELHVWCYYLHEITQDKMINPSNFLTEGEIYVVKSFINKDEFNIKMDKIILNNVIKKTVKGKIFYSCPCISFYDIYKAQTNNLVVYNFETQREATNRVYKNKSYKVETVNKNSVREIKNLVEQDRLRPSQITWNIRQTQNWREGVIYNEEEKTLMLIPNVDREIFIDNIDGYHRTLGITDGIDSALENSNISLEGYMSLSITTFTVDEAQDYIYIQNKQNSIQKEHIESFAKNDINDFVKMLNYEGANNINIMYDKIATTIKEISVDNSKYTTVGILSDGFRLSGLKLDKPRKLEKHLNYFVDIFNNILGYFDEKYNEDEKKMKKETIVLEPNIFVGYIAMGMAIYEEDNPIDKLNEILESGIINLNRKDYDWGSIDIFRKNPKSYKKIYDYFYDLIKVNLK